MPNIFGPTALFIIALVSGGGQVSAGGNPSNIEYCPRAVCNPSIVGVPPHMFNPSKDAKDLRATMKGPGTNEAGLIDILTARSEAQREEISEHYTTQGHNLLTDIEGDTSRSFKKLLVALATPLLSFYTKQLGEAVQKGDRLIAIEILTTLPPHIIRKIAAKYPEVYKKRNLYDDVQGFSLSDALRFSNDDYNNIMKSLALGDRESDVSVNEQKALQDANRLKKDGVDRFGTTESTFIEIFTKRSIPQLAATIRHYERLRSTSSKKVTMEQDLDKEFSGNVNVALKAIATFARDQPTYFAEELNEVLDQWFKSNRDEEKVIRIVRGRCDIDLQDIKRAYLAKYKKSLYSKLEGQFTIYKSDYKKTLLAVVKDTK